MTSTVTGTNPENSTNTSEMMIKEKKIRAKHREKINENATNVKST